MQRGFICGVKAPSFPAGTPTGREACRASKFLLQARKQKRHPKVALVQED